MVNTLIDSACHYLEITAFTLQGSRAEDSIYGWAVTAITDDGLHFIMAKFSKQELAERFRDSMNALLQRIKEKGQ